MSAGHNPRPGTMRIFAWVFLAVLGAFTLAGLTSLAQQTPKQVEIAPTPDARALGMDRGSIGLWQLLLKLHTRASMLHITAHPDDEDGGMLTEESRGHGTRVALMTLNRGEGGQNVMANDFDTALGLDRTEELLAADRFYGVNQYFSTVIDYGFSKDKQEALDKWAHDRVLGDAVRVVRMVRPLVITSGFIGSPTDGHGNHEVAGQVAQEVFNAAGDPNAFPEQIKEGLRPWSPVKDYERVPVGSVTPQGIFDYATGHTEPARFRDYVNNTWIEGQPSTNIEISEGTYDPVLGASYIQIGREGLSQQKTQNGGGAIPNLGSISVPYHRFGSRVQVPDQEKSLYDGMDVSLMGIADLVKNGDASFLRQSLSGINKQVEQAISQFSVDHPEKTAATLADGLKATDALVERVQSSNLPEASKYDVVHELRIKQTQFNNALAIALGFSLDSNIAPVRSGGRGGLFGFGIAADSFRYAIPGQEFFVNVHVTNQSPEEVQLSRVWLTGPQGEDWKFTLDGKTESGALSPAGVADRRFKVSVPANAAATSPYFVQPNPEQAYYDLTDPRYRNLPLAPYPLSAGAELAYHGVTVRLAQVVQSVSRENGLGVVLEPMMVTPAISVAISPKAGVVPLSEKEFSVAVMVKSEMKGPAKGTVHLELPSGWHATPSESPFSTGGEGEEQSVSFRVAPTQLSEKPYTVTAVADYNGQQFKSGFVTTGYPGLRPYNFYSAATYRTSGVDVKVAPDLNIGYIMGTGDDVPRSLESIGIQVHFLGPQDIASGDLQRYNVIVMGVRSYAARPELATKNNRLLDYVRNGGVLIVQYQTAQFDHSFGPYAYSFDNAERVVVEDGEVSILDPQSAVLSWPNQITLQDFKGWIEERGHGFMRTWDSQYEAPIEMHDEGQDPQKGGLLVARYGKGAYVYMALALYRQLPEGVPGSYRLFANLLSLPKNPKLATIGKSGAAETNPGADH